MSRLIAAIEAAENSYCEEIDTLKKIRDDLMQETRDLRKLLRESTQTCSRNTYMLGLCQIELRARGMTTAELEKMLSIVGQPEIENELRPPKEAMDLLARVGAPTTTSTTSLVTDKMIADLKVEAAEAGDLDQVVLCDDALAGSREARSECAKVIESARRRLPWTHGTPKTTEE
jgi:hypothetical protein